MPARSSPEPSTFAAVLRRQREAAGLTQSELADRAGIGERTVSNLERGINTSPYPSTVRLLADALGLADAARTDLLSAAGRRPATTEELPSGGYLGARPVGPLVARETECAAILGALASAAAGQGAVILLAGEPGIGKTRLAQEGIAFAGSRGFLVASGRCFEQQGAAPFLPLLELFGALYDVAPSNVRATVADRWPALAPLLPDVFPSAEPLVLHTSDAVQLLHRAATGFVREIAAHRPLALLLDDLHWADDASAELLTHVVRHTTTDRVLVLGTFRDAEVGSAHPVRTLAHALRRERLTRAITVGRFDRDSTARLIAQRLDEPAVPEGLSTLVHQHSEGNPFFTVEIVTALVERGDLAQVEGHWVCRELTAVQAPVSVGEAIGQRVSRLSPEARGVLEAASVLGVVFDPDDLPSDDADLLERALDEATDSGLVAIVEDGYAFDHSLTQQSLQLGMSPVRRRRLHREVGELLERRPGAAQRRRAGEIASHFEAGGLLDRATEFFLLAGDVAASSYAHADAIRLYEHTCELAEEIGHEVTASTTRERLGTFEMAVGRYDDALRNLLDVAERHRRTADLNARLRVEGILADLRHRRGEGETAAARLDEVLAELPVGSGPEEWADGGAALANGLARVRLFLGQHQLCVEATELAARWARQAGSPAAEAEACTVGGTALFFLDRPTEAAAVLEHGVDLAARIGAAPLESGALMGLQWDATMRGQFARSLEIGERGLELTRRSGNTDQESQHAAGLGRTLFYTGRWDEAERWFVSSLELARAGSPTLFSGIPPLYLGLLRAGQGDLAGAAACYDEAATAPDLQTFAFAGYLQARRAELDLLEGGARAALAGLEPWLAEEAPTKVHDVSLLVVAGEACLAVGNVARADVLLSRALRRAEATGNKVDTVDAWRLAARCRHAEGDGRAARRNLDIALDLADSIGYPAAAARVRADLSRS